MSQCADDREPEISPTFAPPPVKPTADATLGAERECRHGSLTSAFWGKADVNERAAVTASVVDDQQKTFAGLTT
jgi:hypothetical protein